MNLVELFCNVDDYCQRFLPVWHQHLIESNQRSGDLGRSLVTESQLMVSNLHLSE